MKIGIDIDDTIANTFETGIKYAEEFTKDYCNRTYTDIDERLGNLKTHKHWQAIFEWNDEEEDKFFEKYYLKIIEETDIKEEACDILNKLCTDNEIIFITARYEVEENKVETLTKRWLKNNNIPFNKLYLGRNKLEVCQEIGIDVFIDDSFENCKLVQSGNIKTYMIDHIANRNIEDSNIERVYGWNDFYNKIKK